MNRRSIELALVLLLFASTSLAQDELAARCIRDGDGRARCGFHCLRSLTGASGCADTADGACTRDARGDVQCTAFRTVRRYVLDALPAASCITGPDGHAVCGYACHSGGDGHAACADTPDGACGRGGDGVVRCTQYGPMVLEGIASIASSCIVGPDGQVACGWACLSGANGRAACADTPTGACRVGADGVAVCSDLRAAR